MKFTTTRIGTGLYRTEYRGHVVKVLWIDRERRGGFPVGGFWNVFVDGACDESMPTKREALETAKWIVDDMENEEAG